MYFESSFECTIESKQLGDKVATLSPERGPLSITVARAVSRKRVVVEGKAAAAQAGTIGSVVTHFAHWVTVG
jgi:hypothetical protein